MPFYSVNFFHHIAIIHPLSEAKIHGLDSQSVSGVENSLNRKLQYFVGK